MILREQQALHAIRNAVQSKLQKLDLSGYGLSSIPQEINKAHKLRKINLSNNKLVEVPKEILGLTNLRTLDISNNAISSIPFEIGKLKSLDRLYLNNNQLNELSGGLFKLTNLTVLDLSNNSISHLPRAISKLVRLIQLIAANNAINEFPFELCYLNKLEKVVFRNNSISSVPFCLLNLKQLRNVNFNGNKLPKPPIEILHQGIRSILNYYTSVSGINTEKVYEAKLLVVGQGGVGKTFLRNRLVRNIVDKKTVSTEGIEIDTWMVKTPSINNFRINFWDFGGQEIYHATHQFFLTTRSLYVFVWDARKDEDLTSFDYWLNIINLLGDKPPVIVVQNKIDERMKHIDEAYLKTEFPNILCFHNVSAITGDGINALAESVKESIERLEHIGDELPTQWVDTRKALELLTDNYIDYSSYIKKCKEWGLDEKQSSFLSQYYHDLGVVLHFRQNPILNDLVFLKPEWATNALYELVDNRVVQMNYGRFCYGDLKDIWRSYDSRKHIHLLELLKKFELCFDLPKNKKKDQEEREYIIPELLKPSMPDIQWSDLDNLVFIYKYVFMPSGVMTRLIVRCHDIVEDQNFWRQGMVVRREGSRALIISNPLEKTLSIRVSGTNNNALLGIIRREMDHINESLNDPRMEELVPCRCKECKQSESPHYFNYSTLVKFAVKGRNEIPCLKSADDILISKLIGGEYASPRSFQKEVMKILLELKEKSDNEDTLMAKANGVIQLKPNLFGIGLDVNNLISSIFSDN